MFLGVKRGTSVIKSGNADVETVAVSAVEGKPMYGGHRLVKPAYPVASAAGFEK